MCSALKRAADALWQTETVYEFKIFLTPKWANIPGKQEETGEKALLLWKMWFKKINLFLAVEAFEPPKPPPFFFYFFRANPSFAFYVTSVRNSGLPAWSVQNLQSATPLSICWSLQTCTKSELQHNSRRLLLRNPSYAHLAHSLLSAAHPPPQAHRPCLCGSAASLQYLEEEPRETAGEEESTVYQHITHHQLGDFIEHKWKILLSPHREAKTS